LLPSRLVDFGTWLSRLLANWIARLPSRWVVGCVASFLYCLVGWLRARFDVWVTCWLAWLAGISAVAVLAGLGGSQGFLAGWQAG
jgi:hypothetical protein